MWDDECRVFRKRTLADRDYVYVWANGIHFNVRLGHDRLCNAAVDWYVGLITRRSPVQIWPPLLGESRNRKGLQPIRLRPFFCVSGQNATPMPRFAAFSRGKKERRALPSPPRCILYLALRGTQIRRPVPGLSSR